MVYMSARLVVNVSQVFLPFLVLDALDLPNVYITILPCVLYICSMFAATFMQRLDERFGRKQVFCVGFLLTSLGLVGMFFLPPDRPYVWIVYPCAVVVGLGTGVIMVSCTQLTADLIGSRTNYSAFVFGAFSFTDKLSNGLVLFALQAFNNDSATYARWALVAPPVAAAALAIVVLLTQVDLEEWRRKHTLPAHVNVRSRKTPAPRRASINEHKQLTVGDV
jgi:Na+/melibiose symporter-like transporter